MDSPVADPLSRKRRAAFAAANLPEWAYGFFDCLKDDCVIVLNGGVVSHTNASFDRLFPKTQQHGLPAGFLASEVEKASLDEHVDVCLRQRKKTSFGSKVKDDDGIVGTVSITLLPVGDDSVICVFAHPNRRSSQSALSSDGSPRRVVVDDCSPSTSASPAAPPPDEPSSSEVYHVWHSLKTHKTLISAGLSISEFALSSARHVNASSQGVSAQRRHKRQRTEAERDTPIDELLAKDDAQEMRLHGFLVPFIEDALDIPILQTFFDHAPQRAGVICIQESETINIVSNAAGVACLGLQADCVRGLHVCVVDDEEAWKAFLALQEQARIVALCGVPPADLPAGPLAQGPSPDPEMLAEHSQSEQRQQPQSQAPSTPQQQQATPQLPEVPVPSTARYVSLTVRHAHMRDDMFVFVTDELIATVRLDPDVGGAESAAATRRLQEEVRKAEAELKAKARFLAVMSHEMRTPLHGVTSTISLLSDTQLSEEHQELLHIAKVCSEQMLHVINGVLELARLDAGATQLECVPFSLQQTLNEALEIVSLTADKFNLELVCDVPRPLPATVLGDQGRLRQVLLNLIGNACKFSRSGGDVIVRAGSRVSENGTRCELHFDVEDFGIGISESGAAELFQPFKQADSAATGRYGGTGLGLSISKSLVELMGGRIWLASTEGVGSTFSFTVSVGLPPNAAIGAAAQSKLDPHPPRLLVIAASPHVRRTVCAMAAGEGWVGAGLESGDALAGEDANSFRAAIVDTKQGVAALTALRQKMPSCHVFAVLGYFRPSEFDGFALIRKPVRVQSLRDFLSRALVANSPGLSAAGTPDLRTSRESFSDVSTERSPRLLVTPPLPSPPLVGGPGGARSRPSPPKKFAAVPGQPLLAILVADDNSINGMIMKRLLDNIGEFDVVTVTDGKQAVELSAQRHFDLILMDTEMPVLGGIEAARQIRAASVNGGPPIVAVTAHSLAADHAASLEAGAQAVLVKPIDRQQLVDALVRYLPNRAAVASPGDAESQAKAT